MTVLINFHTIKIKHIIYVTWIVFFLYSCSNSTTDCNLTTNRILKANFVTINNNKIIDTLIQFNKITTSEQYMLYDTSAAKQISLPLSQLSDTSIFYFFFNDNIIDTLFIFVQRSIEMVSPDCGFNTFFLINSAQSSLNKLQQIIIIDKEVGNRLKTDRNINLVVKKKIN